MERGLKSYSAYYDALHEEDNKIQEDIMNPITFQAKIDDETM